MATAAPGSSDLAALIEPVARELLGEPNRALSSKTELRYGSRGSFSVDLQKGVWHDHETGQGGGVLDLVTRETGLREEQRLEWLSQHGYLQQRDRTNGHATDGKHLGRIVATYDYTDEAGNFLFQVVKFDPKDFRQRRHGNNGDWQWSVRGVRNVPYRLPELIEAIANNHTVFVVEGEKDVESLRKLNVPTTCNAGGAGKWRPELNPFFRGANVVIIPDRDPQKKHPKTGELLFHPDGRPVLPGQDHAQDIARNLNGIAARVRVLELWQVWPQMPFKGDVSNWLENGGTVELLHEISERVTDWAWEPPPTAAPITIPVCKPFPLDEKTLPPRDWITPGFLMRKQVTVLVAPSGAGKSLMTLQLGIACALRMDWASWRPRQKCRVLMINSEDDVDEVKRRLAAATHVMRGIDQHELADRFMVAEIPDGVVVAKFEARTKTLVRTPKLEQIIATIIQHQIDVVFVDPFAETFEGDENSNSELKWAGVMWREVARRTNAAVCLVHHTKKYATGMAGDVDAARGAGALIGIARIVSTIFPMTPKEAEAMLEEEDEQNRAQYLRYDDAKANLNLTSTVARWFRKDTITLNNATADQPADQVGALVPWKPKGFLDGVLEDQIVKFLDSVDRGILDNDGQPTGEYFTFDARKAADQETSRYIGDH